MHATDRRIAAALAGDVESLELLVAEDELGEIGRRARVASALYLRAAASGVQGPALSAWRSSMTVLSVRHMVFADSLARVAVALEAAGVRWIPLKGCDLASRVYQHVEERTTSDIDLLITASDFEDARPALEADGWSGVASGPRARRYLREEGYAWQATRDDVLLEVHFRLWGSVPEGLAGTMIEASEPDPSLPAGGRRLALRHAYLVAAVHAWLVPPTRGVGIWWDLERLAATSPPSLADEVVSAARRWGLQLPVALASEVAVDLWGTGACRHIAADLAADLRLPERLVLWMARRRASAQTSLGLLSAARLVAGRPSRHRWRVVWRRLWAHAGVVEVATAEEWSWGARRLWYQAIAMGWTRLAKRIENLSNSGAPPAEGRAQR